MPTAAGGAVGVAAAVGGRGGATVDIYQEKTRGGVTSGTQSDSELGAPLSGA